MLQNFQEVILSEINDSALAIGSSLNIEAIFFEHINMLFFSR